MSCSLLVEANSSGIEEDFYTFKDEPLSPLQLRRPIFNHQYRAADSASASSSKAPLPCKVCGDKASGYHYGVTSCEGCKGFFRRSIQKQIEYRCLRDGKCLVIRLNRNRCQFCRFKKCLTVGMSRDSVRYGRVPKRSRDRNEEQSPRPSCSEMVEVDREREAEAVPAQEAPPIIPPTIPEEIVPVQGPSTTPAPVQAEASSTVPDELPMLQQQLLRCGNSSGDEASAWLRSFVWTQLAQRMTPTVQHVVEFAKRLPGFLALPQDDQIILLKCGFFEMWLTKLARLSSENGPVFDDGTTLAEAQLRVAYDTQFAISVFTYCRGLNSIQLTDDEMGLFCGILLLCPDRPGLTDVASIVLLRDTLYDFLRGELEQVDGKINIALANSRLATLARLTDDVRALGERHAELLSWCRDNWNWLALPPLFSEIFDIPKNEIDLTQPEEPAQVETTTETATVAATVVATDIPAPAPETTSE